MIINKILNNINVVIITPHGRSGSMLMQSLFDNHPQVISFPYVYDWYKPYNNDLSSYTNQTLLDTFLTMNPHFLSTEKSGFLGMGASKETKLGKNFNEDIIINKDTFSNNFLEISKNITILDDKQLFILLHIALAKSLEYNIAKLKYILVHIHTYNYSKEVFKFLINSFPNLYYLALVRDIRESWIGWEKVLLDRDPNSISKKEALLSIFSWLYVYIELLKRIESSIIKKNHIKIIDLNKLHTIQENAMINLSIFLKIDYNYCLLKSTFGNKKWMGNSFDKKVRLGFDTSKAIYKWEKKIPEEEQKLFNLYLKHINNIFMYKEGITNSKIKHHFIFLKQLVIIFLTFNKQLFREGILSEKDIVILNNIKTIDDIQNKSYRILPLFIAKKIIYAKIIVNRYISKIKTLDLKNLYCTHLDILKINKNLSQIKIDQELFL